jgi:hypothetical protein
VLVSDTVIAGANGAGFITMLKFCVAEPALGVALSVTVTPKS